MSDRSIPLTPAQTRKILFDSLARDWERSDEVSVPRTSTPEFAVVPSHTDTTEDTWRIVEISGHPTTC